MLISIFSCKKDVLVGSDSLQFSVDTVIFDTVFSTIGSATKILKVYNRGNEHVVISSIRLAGGQKSNYYMNVDGEFGPQVNNIRLRKNDSLFIFIEVTVDPQNSNTPMIVSDSIIFESENGRIQDVDLVAWGQDAYYHTSNAYAAFLDENNDTLRFFYHSVPCNTVWQNDKPHVVYGYAVVDGPCALTIQNNSKIHFYKNSGLIIGNPFTQNSGATLKVQGLLNEPVVFTGTRLESSYKNIPGQWDRIWCTIYSKDNEFHYAHIQNGNIGLQVDSNVNSNPSAIINHSIIQNHSGVCLLGQGAYIQSVNSVFANAGQYIAALIYGGKYEFTHATMVNYWDYGSRNVSSVYVSNYYQDVNGLVQTRPIEKAFFTNCIIHGNIEEELVLDESFSETFNVLFDHCILKTKKIDLSNTSRFVNILNNPQVVDGANPDKLLFTNKELFDYSLSEESVAINKGKSTSVITDINEKPRDSSPDLGAYEYE